MNWFPLILLDDYPSLNETLSYTRTNGKKPKNKVHFLHLEVPTRQPRSLHMASETTVPMGKSKKGKDDSTKTQDHGNHTQQE